MSIGNKVTASSEASYGQTAAIWILASNDQDPTVSYASIAHRLSLGDPDEARKLVAKHPELFRKGIPSSRLERVKEKFRASPPAWLRTYSS
jgi:hypothetical protein